MFGDTRSLMVGTSGGVAVEGRIHLDPLEHQELFQIKRYSGGLRDQILGDQNLRTLVLEVLIKLQVCLAGVGVYRHLGVATSADGGEIVQCDRAAKITDVIPSFIRHQDLQRSFLLGRGRCCMPVR